MSESSAPKPTEANPTTTTTPSTGGVGGKVAKMGKIGAVEVNVIEVRDMKCAYCTVSVEVAERTTKSKRKNELNSNKFDEFFSLPVNRSRAILTVMTWKKPFFGKDKPNGIFAIPVSQIPHSPQEKLTAEWYPLVKPQQKAIGGDIITVSTTGTQPTPPTTTSNTTGNATNSNTTTATTASTSTTTNDDINAPKPIGKTNPSNSSGSIEVATAPKPGEEKPAVGYIRLQLLVRVPEPEVIPRKGISHEGEWKEKLNGGNIIANPYWYENPQYLLTVGSPSTVTISLNQPSDKNEQATFYVLKYNDSLLNGRRKPLFSVDDIVKIEGDFLSPVFSANVEQAYKLSEGMYCVVPCTSFKAPDESGNGRYCGRFVISANANPIEKIAFIPLPLDLTTGTASSSTSASNSAASAPTTTTTTTGWNVLRKKGSWTEETSGGADVSTTLWAKNPQYLLTLTTKSAVCFSLTQPNATRSIGIYVMKVDDISHKAICYQHEISATAHCSFSCSVGVANSSLAADNYVIIPCTYEPHTTGEFEISVFCGDPAARLELFNHDWAHKRAVKGRWEGTSAGGSPNHATFANNPQFLLNLDPKGEGERDFILQLVQHRTKLSTVEVAPVGIVVLLAPQGKNKITSNDLKQENVICQTEGWTAQRSISCRGKVPAGAKAQLVVIPSTFNPAMEHKFNITVLSDSEISFTSFGKSNDSDGDD